MRNNPELRVRPRWMIAALMAAAVAAGCSGSSGPAEKHITIAYSNDMHGEIRSCGCASNDYGGLGRRATFLETVRDTTDDLVLVEGGGFFGVAMNYGREKADLTLKSLEYMGYDGIVLGEEELGLGVDFIVQRSHELGLPVVVANLWDASADTLLFDPSRRIELRSGLRVGIIGVMSERLRLPPQAKGKVRLSSALEAARRQATAMRDSVDVVLLLAHADRTQARIYAQEIDALDVIVHGSEGRAMRRVRPHNNAYILQVGSKGRYMGVAHAVLGENGRIRSLVSAVTPLSMVYEDDAAIAKLFSAYDLDIAAKEKTNIPAGVFATRQGISDSFAGADACQKCHPAIHAQWQETPHAHAFARLKDQSRHFDRDCTPCHTTGFYERGGFQTFAVTPDLVNVQCEACHGNGHAHAADPKKKTPGDARGVCRSCHTVEQTPEFEFDAFWGRIEHKMGG